MTASPRRPLAEVWTAIKRDAAELAKAAPKPKADGSPVPSRNSPSRTDADRS
jgi:hypothetical protein